jgi:predicted dinucleotide-binding enzyme
MKIAVLGTGMVGRAVAAKLTELGHDVVIGTRDVDGTLARTEADRMGNPPYAEWQAEHAQVRLVPFAEAGAHGEIVVNATAGTASHAALEAAGAANLAGKTILDIANPLDFSQGMPPVLSVANTDSLAEQLQLAFPEAHVVKALNTMSAHVMIDPARVPGSHNVFVAGEDAAAKATVTELLRSFGWADEAIVDLGGNQGGERDGDVSAALALAVWHARYRRFQHRRCESLTNSMPVAATERDRSDARLPARERILETAFRLFYAHQSSEGCRPLRAVAVSPTSAVFEGSK